MRAQPSSLDDWFQEALDELRASDLHRSRRRLESGQGRKILLGGREYINFASNDYLGLAGDLRLARAASRAARRYGTGAGASPLVSGLLPPLRRLERALARWEQVDAAIVFSSGFAANLAVVAALAGPDDAIFSDALNHASLIDGCRLSRAAVHIFRHADVNHLEDLLRREGPRARRRLIVTETVFSMDGDLAPLAELVRLAETHDCLLLIDEAHATGVLGEAGRGLSALVPECAAARGRIIKVGTLSKALGAQGGFVCGTRTQMDWIVNRARPYIFSTALAPPSAAAAHRGLAVAIAEPERRQRLHALADLLRAELHNCGFDVHRSASAIVPIILGEARTTLERSRQLQAEGLLVPAIRPPSVPEGMARLRISLTAAHSEEDVRKLIEALDRSPPPR